MKSIVKGASFGASEEGDLATLTFSFTNSQADQTIQVLDLIDTTHNLIFNQPMNYNDESGPMQCNAFEAATEIGKSKSGALKARAFVWT